MKETESRAITLSSFIGLHALPSELSAQLPIYLWYVVLFLLNFRLLFQVSYVFLYTLHQNEYLYLAFVAVKLSTDRNNTQNSPTVVD